MTMHSTAATKSRRRGIAIAVASLLSALALAQELKSAPATTSTGTIGLTLEKLNSNTQPGVTVSVPGRGALPVVLPQAVANALVNKRNASFPLCITGSGTKVATLSPQSGTANSGALTSSTGSRVNYNVGVGNKQNNSKQSAPANTCAGGSLVEVEISIAAGVPTATSALFGVIPLLIITE